VAQRLRRFALFENLVSAVPRRTSCRLLLSVDSLGGRTDTPSVSNQTSAVMQAREITAIVFMPSGVLVSNASVAADGNSNGSSASIMRSARV